MCTNLRTGSIAKIMGYTYPCLHKGAKWYVDFYALDPKSSMMRRKKVFISKCDKAGERKKRAAEIIEALTRQLAKGWNPWITNNQTRGAHKFEEAVQTYLDYVERMDRQKTRDSYRSKVNILREFIQETDNSIFLAYEFDQAFCSAFLDWIYLDRDNSARTRNNYRGWLFGFAEFMIERRYIKENPVADIKSLNETEKIRKDLTPEMLKKMADHLKNTDKHFYLACMMQYYTLIRPNELSNLKIGDISLKKQTVFVSKDFSKNHRDAEVGLNTTIIHLMLDLGILTKPSDYYLFSEDFRPGKDKVHSDQFNKRWRIMRDALGWSKRYQFYSLKDTGIRDLANAEGVVVARDQARHSDIATTNKYIQRHGVQESTLKFEGGLTYKDEKEKDSK